MYFWQLATIFSGHPFRGSVSPRVGSGFYAVRTRDIATDNTVNWSTVVEAAPTSRRAPRWLQVGDILVALRRKPHVAILLDKVPKSAVASPHFMVIRVSRTDILIPEFLAIVLNYGVLPEISHNKSPASNSAHLRVTEFVNMPFEVPPIATQLQVVSVAKQLSQLRSAHTTLANSIMSMLQSIAREPGKQDNLSLLHNPQSRALRDQLAEGYDALSRHIESSDPIEIRESNVAYISNFKRIKRIKNSSTIEKVFENESISKRVGTLTYQ